MSKKQAIIIGAGPSGLTAAYELLEKTDIQPIIFESTHEIGGISKTVVYKNNRIDIGGHRFFSKSDKIMNWWFNVFPIQGKPSKDDILLKRTIPLSKEHPEKDPEKENIVMLIRNRLSRIFFLRKFFDYPVSLNLNTLFNLGLLRIIKIGFSYIKICLFPIKNEKTLEEFFTNRFGRELYLTFFKDYTEKVWGAPCSEISADWGAQRVKGLSISKTILHAIKKIFIRNKNSKNVETSLIEQFYYPKYGPGQLWERVADLIKEKGGKIYMNSEVIGIHNSGKNISSILVKDKTNNMTKEIKGDYFISTMPIKDLIQSFKTEVPQIVEETAKNLKYRDFMTVGLLLNKLKLKNKTKIPTIKNIVPDTWIYVQERDVKIGRLQIFNNWSPYLVEDLDKVWIGLEYFCNEGDELWTMADSQFTDFAISELVKIDIIEKQDVLDACLIRVPKTYPAYFGSYKEFDQIRNFTDQFENLFLVRRNGMHRYNNMDHSMMTAMLAVENIKNGIKDKNNIWDVNTEDDYHEEKK